MYSIPVLGNTCPVDRCVCGADGFVSAGQAVSAGGGADHVRTATAQPGQDEGNQENLQVRLSLANDVVIS